MSNSDTKQTVVNHKAGVLLAKKNQFEEDEFYCNGETTRKALWFSSNSFDAEKDTESFKEFYSALGDVIQLKGWKQFNGGLDVESKSFGLVV